MPDKKPKRTKKREKRKEKKVDYLRWMKTEQVIKFLKEKFPENTNLAPMYLDGASTKNIAKYADKTEEELIEAFDRWNKEN